MMKFLKGFIYAFNGFVLLIKTERNFKFHFLALVSVVCAGYYFGIDQNEWLMVLVTSAMVLSLEAINTAIEKLCDLYSPEQNNTIKQIKDIAAGAVLIAAIFAVIIGLIIFFPYIFNYFTEK